MILEFENKRPKIHRTAFVADNTTLIGDIVLCEDSSVWYGSVLRGDINSITVGARSNIQDLCIVHVDTGKPVVIGDDVTVGHGAILHGCIIEDRCLIGMGAIVLDGAIIRTGAVVGAGALVPPGKEVKARTLVAGVPAQKLRGLTEEDYESLKHHAKAYADYANRHKKI